MATAKSAEAVDTSTRPVKPRRGRLPLLVAATVLAVLGANYYLYVRSKTQYFTTRDLRLLAMLGRQVDDGLRSQRQFVRNFAEDTEVFPEFKDRDLVYADLDERQRKIADRNFPGFIWMSRSGDCAGDLLPKTDAHGEALAEEIVEVNGEPRLRIAYRGSRLDTDIVVGCGEIRLASVLQDAFRATMVEPFDAVMLVDGTGNVLHRAAPQHQTAVRGFGAARTAHDAAYRRDVYGTTVDLRLNNLTALSERSGWTGSKPFDVAALGATCNTDVKIADTGYFLFAQPSPISILRKKTDQTDTATPAAGTTPPVPEKKDEKKEPAVRTGDPNRWSFVALVAKRRFMYEALAVSETVLAAVAGLLLLIVAAWPFMRLSLISEFKPVRITDVIFLGVSTVVAAAIFTIAVADAVVYRRLEAVSDVHLRQFAMTLENRFGIELLNALKALDHIKETWNWDIEEKHNAGSFETVEYMHAKDPADYTHPLNIFPFFSTFSWIDRNGVQDFKRSVGAPIPRVKVADREYFNRVFERRTWLAREGPDPTALVRPFALGSHRSMTTGVPEIVVAVPTEREEHPVLAMTLSASQLIDPVLPAGFTFAVIDERGGVLFHSDVNKNVMENFFEESDQNRQFRSAVFARHAAHVDLRYDGQDYRAYVTPMKDLPWMTVILRHKQLLRTMNAETIVITMTCLAFLVTGAVILTFVVCLLRPRYRAPWLWPDYGRGSDYARLCRALLVLLSAGIVTLVFYESGALIIACFLLPPIALVTIFGALHWRGGWIFMATVLLWLVLAAAWVYSLAWQGQIAPSPVRAADLSPYLVGVLLFISGFLTLRRWSGGTATQARRAHTAIGVLLLVTVAIVPTLGFYKAAHRLEIQNLIKYSQLTLAERLQQRAESVISAGYRPTTLYVRRWEIPAAFSTRWWLLPPNERPPAAYNCTLEEDKVLLPSFLEEFMPQYSEYAVAMRKMHFDAASHEKWWWCRDGMTLSLHKIIRLPPDEVVTKLWPNEEPGKMAKEPPAMLRGGLVNDPAIHRLGWVDVKQDEQSLRAAQAERAERAVQKIVISSVVPNIVPPALRPDPTFPYPSKTLRAAVMPWAPDDETICTAEDREAKRKGCDEEANELPLARALRLLMYTLMVAVFAACLWWAVRFIGKVIFLTDVLGPLWLSRKLRARIGEPIYLIRKEGTGLDAICEDGFHRVQLNLLSTDYGLQKALAEIDQLPTGSCVLIEDFENGASASACARKLRLLEHVLRLPQRSIVIVSTISPMAMVAIAQSSGADPEAWNEILKRFIWISDDQLKPNAPESAPGPAKTPALREQWSQFRSEMKLLKKQWPPFLARVKKFGESFLREDQSLWLQREAARDPLLETIADELGDHQFMSPSQVTDEFRERAASYYDLLWSGCTEDEKLILSQLAHEGLVNGKNRRAVRRLFGRGLIKRKAQLSLLNESFRKYVLGASVAEEVDVKHVHEHDTWSAISRPLALVVIALIVMFLVTQKDLANTASAVVTALAGGVPALIKLIGVLTDRKQSAA